MTEYETRSLALLERIATAVEARRDASLAVAAAVRAVPATHGGGDGALTLPNYGRSKGLPIVGASLQDLEFYANGARRSIADPSKARFHGKEQALLTAIEAEIARQSGGQAPPPDDGPPDAGPPPF